MMAKIPPSSAARHPRHRRRRMYHAGRRRRRARRVQRQGAARPRSAAPSGSAGEAPKAVSSSSVKPAPVHPSSSAAVATGCPARRMTPAWPQTLGHERRSFRQRNGWCRLFERTAAPPHSVAGAAIVNPGAPLRSIRKTCNTAPWDRGPLAPLLRSQGPDGGRPTPRRGDGGRSPGRGALRLRGRCLGLLKRLPARTMDRGPATPCPAGRLNLGIGVIALGVAVVSLAAPEPPRLARTCVRQCGCQQRHRHSPESDHRDLVRPRFVWTGM